MSEVVAQTPPTGKEAPKPEEKKTLILDKFETQDDLIKAYKELEGKLGAKPEEKAPVAGTPITIEQSGVDLIEIGREFAEKGELSTETRTKLKAAKVSDESINSYIEGQKAIAAQITTEVQKIAGGAEEYGKVLNWFEANKTAKEVKAFNQMMHSGDLSLMKLAIKGAVSEYSDSVGTDGKLVTGEGSPATAGIKPFASRGEMTEAMRSPKYNTQSPQFDQAYHDNVLRRMSVTTAF